MDPVGFRDKDNDPRYINRYMYTGSDPVNALDIDGMQIIENKSLKITVSTGLSPSINYHNKGSQAGSDAVIEFGIGVPGADRGEPIPFTGGILPIDAKASLQTNSVEGSERGLSLDVDVVENGVSLGTIDDRAGAAKSIKADGLIPGVEVSSNGELAGTTLKLSAGVGLVLLLVMLLLKNTMR